MTEHVQNLKGNESLCHANLSLNQLLLMGAYLQNKQFYNIFFTIFWTYWTRFDRTDLLGIVSFFRLSFVANFECQWQK